MADGVLAPAVLAGVVVLVLGGLWWAARARRAFGTVEERATYAALHQASLAAPRSLQTVLPRAVVDDDGEVRLVDLVVGDPGSGG